MLAGLQQAPRGAVAAVVVDRGVLGEALVERERVGEPVLLEELLARFPDYGIDGGRIEFRSADQLRGMTSLPLILR